MRAEIIEYISQNKDLQNFLREQPIWYRKLSRHPYDLEKFEIAAMNYYKRTIPHKIERLSNGMHIAKLMLNMLQNKK